MPDHEKPKAPPEMITYRGVPMIAGWPDKIRKAQEITIVEVEGKDYPRIRFGDESQDSGAIRDGCRDCGVIKGEYHVWECAVERCPKCGGQLITCNCDSSGVSLL